MRILIYFMLLALATGIAIWRGTPVERALGATLIAGNLATLAIVQVESSGQYSSVLLWYFLTDALLAILLCGVAVRWPTWASILIAAFQVNGLLGHVVKLASPETFPISYAMLLKIWGWSMVVVLLLSRYRPNMRRPLSGQRWPYFSRAQDGRTIASG
jgi:hypothetical protein